MAAGKMTRVLDIKPYLVARTASPPASSQQLRELIRPGHFVRYPVPHKQEVIFHGNRPPEGWWGDVVTADTLLDQIHKSARTRSIGLDCIVLRCREEWFCYHTPASANIRSTATDRFHPQDYEKVASFHDAESGK